MNKIHDAVERMNRASGVKASIDARQNLQRAVRDGRAAEKPSQFLAVYRQARAIWEAMRADGVPLAECVLNLSKSLRIVWPQVREWKYLCDCNDTGLRMSDCPGDATCGRTVPHLPHDFGTPCWCELGKRFRPKPKPSEEDAVATAARTSKGFTRAGR